jgi:hypothetical protein
VTRGAAVALGLLVTGCALVRPAPAPPPARRFVFPADAFAFENGVHWRFVDDAQTGARVWTEIQPRPRFALRCTAMVRAARQFLVHARFEPDAPRADAASYRELISAVLARDPRAPSPGDAPIVIPGYTDLRHLSADFADELEGMLRHDWRSVLPRGDWRLFLPTSPAGQARTAAALAEEIAAGRAPLVRVMRFPVNDLNHAVLLMAVERADDTVIRFRAYDPNDAQATITIVWDRTARTFRFPARVYFGGGPVKIYPIYDGVLS